MANILPKGLLIGAAAAFGLAVPVAAQGLFEPTDGDFYISGFVGGFFPDDDLGDIDLDDIDIDIDDDVYFGGAIGASLPFKSFGFIQTRIEAEVSYTELDVGLDDDSDLGIIVPDNADFDLLFIQANSYADLKFSDDPLLIPYIGGGLGVAIADVSGIAEGEFVTNNSIGVTLPINKLDLYTEGRYTRIWVDGPDFDSFSWTAGLRIRF
ncbi:MAG: hypothetical protein AAFY34_13845 [Pseudomonadota bacterium]